MMYAFLRKHIRNIIIIILLIIHHHTGSDNECLTYEVIIPTSELCKKFVRQYIIENTSNRYEKMYEYNLNGYF